MASHLYNQLARTHEGCAYLSKKNVVLNLLTAVHILHPFPINYSKSFLSQQENYNINNSAESFRNNADLRSFLWSLGQIGATELGFMAISNYDPKFTEWCIENVIYCPNISLRGTFFYVLGLLSRTKSGANRLRKLNWDISPTYGSSAVSIPRKFSILFKPISSKIFSVPSSDQTIKGTSDTDHSLDSSSLSGSHSKSYTPFSAANLSDLEQEVLSLISKVRLSLTF